MSRGALRYNNLRKSGNYIRHSSSYVVRIRNRRFRRVRLSNVPHCSVLRIIRIYSKTARVYKMIT
jgi:hypothetical protein